MKKYLLLILVFVVLSCNDIGNEKITHYDIARIAWNRGWIAGANAVIELVGDGVYSTEMVKLKLLEDSVKYEKILQ